MMSVDIVNDRDQLMNDVEDNSNLLLERNKVDEDQWLIVVVAVVEYQTVQLENKMLLVFDTFDWHYENNDDDDIVNGMN